MMKRENLQTRVWEDIDEPGAYVDVSTGDLYRVPEAALPKGGLIPIRKHSAAGSWFVQVSKNPFINTLEARMICAVHDIQSRF